MIVAQGTKSTTKEKLEREIEWFEKYLKLDKVYLEAFRGDSFASEEQVRMVKETFEEHGSSRCLFFDFKTSRTGYLKVA